MATSSADILTGIHKEGDNVSIAGIVVEKTIRLTKNSEKFAIVRLEDLRGILELPIYSRIYNDYGHLLEMDEPLLVSGRISFRDDEFGLVADRLGMHEDFGRKPCGKRTNYQPYSHSVGK